MENKKNNFKFTFAWSFCLFLLLTLVGLGVSSSVKGTKAAVTTTCICPNGGKLETGSKCVIYIDQDVLSSYMNNGWNCDIAVNGETSDFICVQDAKCSSESAPSSSSSESAPSSSCSGSYDVVTGECVSEESTTTLKGLFYVDGVLKHTMTCEAPLSAPGCKVSAPALPSGYSFWSSSSNCSSGSANMLVTKNGQTAGQNAFYACIGETEEEDGFCYLQGGIYKWATTVPTNGQIVTGVSKNDCESMNDVTATFYKYDTGEPVGSRTCTLISKNGSAFPCTVTAPSLPSGYSKWSSSSSCSDSLSTFLVAQGGTSYYACASGGSGGDYVVDPDPPSSSNPTSRPSSNQTSNPTSRPTNNPEPPTDPTSKPLTDSEPTADSGPSSDVNVEENPPTSEIAIFVVWVVAAMAIVYSVWYFKQVRDN